LGSNAFKSHHVNLKIYVPSSNVDDYKTASNWDTYSENIYSLEE